MARFHPFRGTTYDPSQVVPDDVVAPPYDVVGPAERADLAARSPYNAIHVELPADPGGGDRYTHAARTFAAWHDDGVVRVAPEPSFYLYRMTFSGERGEERSTTGLIGALGLDPSHSGEVLPHEETTPKDKSDRLMLLGAARANFSPIWGLSLTEGFGALCEAQAEGAGEGFRATDSSGAVHECWQVSDPAFLEAATALIGSSPVLIADGHHRYETACAFSEEDSSEGARAVMALVIELSDEQLNVEAIHRLLTGVGEEALLEQLANSFEIEKGPSEVVALRGAMDERGGLGLYTPSGGYLLVPQEEGDELDSVRLRQGLEGLAGAEVTYQHGLEEVAAAVDSGTATAAVLLRPVSVAQIAATAHGGGRMPPKSTFFYPKLLTGMAFRELDAG